MERTAPKNGSFSSIIKDFTWTEAGEKQFSQIMEQETKGEGLFSSKGTYKKS